MNYILHRDAESQSVLHLEKTYRLTIGVLAKMMEAALKSRSLKSWPATGSITLKDFRCGICVMNRVANHGTAPVTITYWDAYYALLVCAYLSTCSSVMTPRLKSMLREAVMIFSDCSAVTLRVAYVMPFDSLEAKVQKTPAIARHYRAIEAKASLALEGYALCMTDAMDLLNAIKGIRTIKIELLRQALETATAGIREVIANITEEVL